MNKKKLNLNSKFYREYSFEEIPQDRDSFIIPENDLNIFIDICNKINMGIPTENVNHPNEKIDYRWCFVEKLDEDSCDINICVTMNHRFHGVMKKLPKNMFIGCIQAFQFESRPYIVVKDEWIESLQNIPSSIYCMIDIIGIKNYLNKKGIIGCDIYDDYQKRINNIAKNNPEYIFLSFADSLIIKANWEIQANMYNKTYNPEKIIIIIKQIHEIIFEIFKLNSYAIITQGINYVETKDIEGISANNYLSIPSISAPFAELFDIEEAVKKNIKNHIHKPYNLYISESVLLTLKFINFKMRDYFEYFHYQPKSFVQSWNRYSPVIIETIINKMNLQ